MTEAALSSLLAPYLKRPAVARLKEPEVASGRCKEAAFRLAAWLKGEGQAATVLNLAEPVGVDPSRVARFWQEGNLPFAIHYVVLVGDLTIDMTARQFDPDAPFPALKTLAELQSSWRVGYDTEAPLTAGPLWTQ